MKDKLIGISIFTFLIGLIIGRLIPTQHEPHEEEHSHDEHHDHMDITQEQLEEAGIKTQEAKAGKLHFILSTRGKIIQHPDKLVHLLPKIDGIVKEAYKNIGDNVKTGELLAVLESSEMADAKAEYSTALEKERLAEIIFEREEKLHEKKISSSQDFFNAKAALLEAKIQTDLFKQKLLTYGLNEKDLSKGEGRTYEIYSPIDGKIISRHLTKGEWVESNSTIYEISDLSTVWVEIGIYPKDIDLIKEGQEVEIIKPGGKKSAKAKLFYLSPLIHEETITAEAIASLENVDLSWRPGTFVTVKIESNIQDVPVMIPKEAIQQLEGKHYVFVKIDHGFEKREIELGKTDNENVEILSGLQVGEIFASANTFLIKADLGKESVEHEH